MSRRESESEDEKMKALAAVLSDDDSRRYQYTRDQLLSIRQSALSCVRPEYLSVEFDNEDGKFMPEKWLEYRWMCEGVENRPSAGARRKEKLKAEALESADSTVLSPQRRAFSSGCRAASPSKNEGEPERLGANKGNWRSGAGFMLKNSTSTDFKPAFQKNATSGGGNESSSYAKTRMANGERGEARSGSSSNSNWRAAGDGNFRPGFHKDSNQGRRNASSGEEKMPEWLNEGPTSMLDMIELKGFDDEQHGKSKRVQSARSKRETVASKQLQQAMSSSCQRSARNNTSAHQQQPSHSSTVTSSSSATSSASSRTTSSSITAPSANNITPSQTPPIATSGDKTDKDNDYEKASDKDSALKHSTLAQQNEHCSSTSGTNQTVRIPPELAASMSPILNGKLPNSDAEFAAIFGLLGENDLNSIKQKDTNSTALQPPSVTGSRLSRFFATPLSNDQPNANAESDGTNSTSGGTSRITPPNANVPSPLQSSSSSTTTANPILQKLFNSSPQQTAQAPVFQEMRSAIPLQHMMRVEDLERGFQQEAAANSATAPNSSSNAPFQKEFISDDGSEHLRALGLDTVPSSNYLNKHAMKDASYQHQMHLMNNNNNANSILSRLSSTQASASAVRAPLPQSNLASQHQYMSYPTSTTSLSTPSPNLLPPPNNSDQTVTALQAAAFMRQQYEAAAILQQIHALQQQQQQLTGGASGAQFGGDFNAVRSLLSGGVVPSVNNTSQSSSSATQSRPSSATTTSSSAAVPNTFMPTSVMRHMTKNSTNSHNSSSDDKQHHHYHANVAPSNSANSNNAVVSASANDERHDATAPPTVNNDANINAQKQSASNMLPNTNNMDVLTRLSLQQQYSQVIAAMQGGLSMGACRPPTSGQQAAAASQQQMAMAAAAAIRAQLMASSQAAAAEYQRQQQQLAMAMLNGDVNQAQAIRARLFQTQQQAALLASQHYAQQQQQQMVSPILGLSHNSNNASSNTAPMPAVCTPNSSSSPSNQPLKFQNPLERLLQSAGVTSSQQQPTAKSTAPIQRDSSTSPSSSPSVVTATATANSTNALPSIISRLPPSANCISVEELERQFATN